MRAKAVGNRLAVDAIVVNAQRSEIVWGAYSYGDDHEHDAIPEHPLDDDWTLLRYKLLGQLARVENAPSSANSTVARPHASFPNRAHIPAGPACACGVSLSVSPSPFVCVVAWVAGSCIGSLTSIHSTAERTTRVVVCVP